MVGLALVEDKEFEKHITEMLLKLNNSYSKRLGTIEATHHTVELKNETRHFCKQHYCA